MHASAIVGTKAVGVRGPLATGGAGWLRGSGAWLGRHLGGLWVRVWGLALGAAVMAWGALLVGLAITQQLPG